MQSNHDQSPSGKFADVPVRVRSWGYIILVLAVAIAHPIAMYGFTAWLTFQGLLEFNRLFRFGRYFLIVSFLLSLIQFGLLYLFTYHQYFVYSLLILFVVVAASRFIQTTLKNSLVMVMAIATCFIAFGHLAFVRTLTSVYINDDLLGIKLIIFLVVVTELNDVFQYLNGKFFGRHAIVPSISPNKTVEGFIGGICLTVLLSNGIGFLLLPFQQVWIYSGIGFTLGIFGFCGDVLMSAIKRKAGVKDTGTLIPGHGGLLDRMDSLIVNAPLFYLISCYLLNG